MRKKKTALQNPGDRKASPNQTKGLIAKGKNRGNQSRRSASLTITLIERLSGCRTGLNLLVPRLSYRYD